MTAETINKLIVFLATWTIVSSVFYLFLEIPEKTTVALFLGLFSGFIVCGGGNFVWEHRTGK